MPHLAGVQPTQTFRPQAGAVRPINQRQFLGGSEFFDERLGRDIRQPGPGITSFGAQPGQTPPIIGGNNLPQPTSAPQTGFGITNIDPGTVLPGFPAPSPVPNLPPQTGLSGAESALRGGLTGGVGAVQQGTQSALNTLLGGFNVGQGQLQQGISALQGVPGAQATEVDLQAGQGQFQQGIQGLQQFQGAGQQAQQRLAALTGASGVDAQRQAFADFTASPGQEFLQREGQNAIINQAAATGGLGGGNVQRELTRFGQGLAQQDLQNQISNLGDVTGQGLQAAGQAGQLFGQAGGQVGQLTGQRAQLGTQANISNANRQGQLAQAQAQLFGQGAGAATQLAGQGAGLQFGAGQNIAGQFGQTAGQLAGARTGAGRDIAAAIGGTTGRLSNLSNQQGQNLSDIFGAGGINIAELQRLAGTAGGQQQLAALLANISTQQGTQLGGFAQNTGQVGAQAQLSGGQNINNLLQNLLATGGATGFFGGNP